MLNLRGGSSAGRYPFGKENLMPSVAVSTPVSSAATDRLALGVGWVRPGVGGIGGSLNPLSATTYVFYGCFEGCED